MELTFKKTSNININNQLSMVFTKILPFLLIFITVYFVLGLRINKNLNNNEKKENWINYINIPFGEVQTGSDCTVGYYERPEYRKPYRWPLGINQSYPVEHIAPLMG